MEHSAGKAPFRFFNRGWVGRRRELLAEAPEDYREYAVRGDKQRTTVLMHEIEDKIRATLGLKLLRREVRISSCPFCALACPFADLSK
jgi:hypothetical protein